MVAANAVIPNVVLSIPAAHSDPCGFLSSKRIKDNLLLTLPRWTSDKEPTGGIQLSQPIVVSADFAALWIIESCSRISIAAEKQT